MLKGYIKIHRKFMEWGWYKDPNTKAVFLHLLLLARFNEGKYMNQELEPGQVIVGRKKLAEELGLSERNVRTALKHLISTNEVTIKSTNKWSVVTIVNWAKYQFTDDEVTTKATNNLPNNRPASDQQVTTTEECKERKNDNNDYSSLKGEDKKSDFDMVQEQRAILRQRMKAKGMI